MPEILRFVDLLADVCQGFGVRARNLGHEMSMFKDEKFGFATKGQRQRDHAPDMKRLKCCSLSTLCNPNLLQFFGTGFLNILA